MPPSLMRIVLLTVCAHAAPAGSHEVEVLATPAALAEARAGWIASTVRLARALVMRAEFQHARTLLGSALEHAVVARDGPGRARLQAELALAMAEEAFDAPAVTERGLQIAAAAQAAARATGAREVEAQALHAEGFLRYGALLWADAKDYAVPRDRFEKARALQAGLGNAPGVARETFFLGLTYEQEGKAGRAGALYLEARALAEHAGDRETLAYALRHLAGLHESRGELEQALAMHRRCLALREEIGLIRLVPYALIAVGDVERRKGALGDAWGSYTRALAVAEELRSTPARVRARFGLGAVDEAEGRLASALEQYRSARRGAEELGSESWVRETGAAAEKVQRKLEATQPAGQQRAAGSPAIEGGSSR